MFSLKVNISLLPYACYLKETNNGINQSFLSASYYLTTQIQRLCGLHCTLLLPMVCKPINKSDN